MGRPLGTTGAGNRFGVLLPLVLALVLGCDDGSDCLEGPGVTFATHLTLTKESGEPSTAFELGETIVFVLRVTNRSRIEQRLDFPTSCQVRFVVSDAAGTRILFDAPDLCAYVLTSLHFEPGETRTFSWPWHQVSDDGEPLDPGIYNAQGQLLTDLPGAWSQVVPFQISRAKT